MAKAAKIDDANCCLLCNAPLVKVPYQDRLVSGCDNHETHLTESDIRARYLQIFYITFIEKDYDWKQDEETSEV